jgi:PAS domain-containing protein
MQIVYLDEEKINRSTDMISRYDKELYIKGWNPACEKRFHISEAEALNKRLEDLFPSFNLEKDYRINCLKDAIHGKSFFFSNLPFHYGQGRYFQAIVPLKINQVIVGALSVVRDAANLSGRPAKKDLLVPLINTDPVHINHLTE